jgi:hypothetical protein
MPTTQQHTWCCKPGVTLIDKYSPVYSTWIVWWCKHVLLTKIKVYKWKFVLGMNHTKNKDTRLWWYCASPNFWVTLIIIYNLHIISIFPWILLKKIPIPLEYPWYPYSMFVGVNLHNIFALLVIAIQVSKMVLGSILPYDKRIVNQGKIEIICKLRLLWSRNSKPINKLEIPKLERYLRPIVTLWICMK